jgi:hypothetical protein
MENSYTFASFFMTLLVEALEKFFESKFEFEGGPLGQLTHFDGFAYWHLLYYSEGGGLVKIVADSDSTLRAFPTVEIEGVFADEFEVGPLSGEIGTVLILHPKGAKEGKYYVCITKTTDGRMSLATSVS